MALSNYTELKAAVASWLNRSDLTAAIPDFIKLAEARLNSDLRLRTMETDEDLTATIGARTIALPGGFLEPLALFIVRDTGRDEMAFAPARMATSTDAGEPTAWTVDGANIAFDRPCDAAYDFTLRMLEASALSDGAPTNWLLTNNPNLYLFATLIEGFDYLKDKNQVASWTARYNEARDRLQEKEGRSRKLARLRTDLPVSSGSAFDIHRGY